MPSYYLTDSSPTFLQPPQVILPSGAVCVGYISPFVLSGQQFNDGFFYGFQNIVIVAMSETW